MVKPHSRTIITDTLQAGEMPTRVVSIVGSLAEEAALEAAAQLGSTCLVEGGDLEPLPRGVVKRMVLQRGAVLEHRAAEVDPLTLIAGSEACDHAILVGLTSPLALRILAVEGEGEAWELADELTVAVTSRRKIDVEGLRFVPMGELGAFIAGLPIYPAWLNCGECGFETCFDYLRAAAGGEDVFCPPGEPKPTVLRVNDRPVGLVRFVERQLRELALAYLRTLKGVPRDIKKVELRISLTGDE